MKVLRCNMNYIKDLNKFGSFDFSDIPFTKLYSSCFLLSQLQERCNRKQTIKLQNMQTLQSTVSEKLDTFIIFLKLNFKG